MKRREAIQKSGWMLKAAVFSPGLISVIQSCQSKVPDIDGLQVLSNTHYQLASNLADTIIPKTDSASASEVKVVEFIDLLLTDVFDQQVSESFITGLQQFDEDCRSRQGKSFNDLNQNQRNEYLEPIDQEVMSASYDHEVPFYYTFKKLCVNVYYSTEQGVKQNLDYRPIPGSYQGDVELQKGEKIIVGNQM